MPTRELALESCETLSLRKVDATCSSVKSMAMFFVWEGAVGAL